MKYYRRLLVSALVAGLISFSCVRNNSDIIPPPLPEGWRAPTVVEISDEWRRKDPDNHVSVKADFNGDGIKDYARLLISNNHEHGLFAFISQKNKTYKAILLDKKDDNYIKAMGISKVFPGKYLTVCGKGVMDCKEGYPDEIILHNEAINYFKVESANGFYYWDIKTSEFKFIGIND